MCGHAAAEVGDAKAAKAERRASPSAPRPRSCALPARLLVGRRSGVLAMGLPCLTDLRLSKRSGARGQDRARAAGAGGSRPSGGDLRARKLRSGPEAGQPAEHLGDAGRVDIGKGDAQLARALGLGLRAGTSCRAASGSRPRAPAACTARPTAMSNGMLDIGEIGAAAQQLPAGQGREAAGHRARGGPGFRRVRPPPIAPGCASPRARRSGPAGWGRWRRCRGTSPPRPAGRPRRRWRRRGARSAGRPWKSCRGGSACRPSRDRRTGHAGAPVRLSKSR